LEFSASGPTWADDLHSIALLGIRNDEMINAFIFNFTSICDNIEKQYLDNKNLILNLKKI